MSFSRTLIISLLCLIFHSSLNAQATAWISTKEKKDSTVFQGMIHNNTEEILALKYTFIVEKAGINGQTRNHQQAEFKAVPKSTIPLGEQILNLKSDDYCKATLLVFQNNKLIAADTLQQGTPPIPIASAPKKALPKVHSKSDAIEIDGLIIDETRTKSARDFYEIFYNNWSAPYGARDYTIIIRELPSRGRAAQVVVAVNGQDVVQRFLQPRLDVIEAMAGQAIYHVSKYLSKNESLKQQMKKEDHQGSGIF